MHRLANAHQGEDIYVIGSGPSCSYIEPEFFADRIAIGVNHAYKRFPVNYVIMKENLSERTTDLPLIASRYAFGSHQHPENKADYIFSHHDNRNNKIKWQDLQPNGERFVVSNSTITSAIHIAAFMGARAVFLVGHDCCEIDGDLRFEGYNKLHEQKENAYRRWVSELEVQTMQVRDYIKREYGIPVHSINPFVSMRMEGHTIR